MFGQSKRRNFRRVKKEVLGQAIVVLGFVLAAIAQEAINMVRLYMEQFGSLASFLFFVEIILIGILITSLLMRLVSDASAILAISSQNISGDTVPRGARGVSMLSFTLQASGEDDIKIKRLTISHTGDSSRDIDKIYLTMDGARVSSPASFDDKGSAILHLKNSIPIKAGEKITLDINADFSPAANAGGQHQLSIQDEGAFVSNANATGKFPTQGATFKVAAVSAGIVNLEYIRATGGDVISSFTVSSDATEDQTLYAITFSKRGSIDDQYISRIFLTDMEGKKLTNRADKIVEGKVTLVFDPPYTILKEDVQKFVLHAQLKSSGKIEIYIEETSDVFAVGNLYGYGNNGQLFGSYVQIQGIPLSASF